MEKALHTALLAVQKELPIIKRDAIAKVLTKAGGEFYYNYASLDKIWEKVGAIISKNEFVIVNEVTPEGVLTRAIHPVPTKTLTETKSTDTEEITSFFSFSGALKPQERGSEITYGRRYNLTAIFNIQLEDEDDDGKSANDKATPMARTTVQSTGLGNCENCGAPKRMSKAGKAYCSALCWKNPKQGRQMDDAERAFFNSLPQDPIPVTDGL